MLKALEKFYNLTTFISKKLPMAQDVEYNLVLKDKFSKFTTLYPHVCSPDSLFMHTGYFELDSTLWDTYNIDLRSPQSF